ncbi:hypothetical protein TNCV_2710011 [Trichonephila clavipes]|nr:hypothetical protein TNCV_2710011 [Trichonephila clavipes]
MSGPPQRPTNCDPTATNMNVLDLGVFAMSLKTLPEFNDTYEGTLPNSLHEEVQEDISYCPMVKSYQFSKYLQQFNKLQAACVEP